MVAFDKPIPVGPLAAVGIAHSVKPPFTTALTEVLVGVTVVVLLFKLAVRALRLLVAMGTTVVVTGVTVVLVPV